MSDYLLSGRQGRVRNTSADHWRTGWPIRYPKHLLAPDGSTFRGLSEHESAEILATFDILKWMRDPRHSVGPEEFQQHILKPMQAGELRASSDIETTFKVLGGYIDIRRLDHDLWGYYRVKTFEHGGSQGQWRAIFRIFEKRQNLEFWVKPGKSTRVGWKQSIEVVGITRRDEDTYQIFRERLAQ